MSNTDAADAVDKFGKLMDETSPEQLAADPIMRQAFITALLASDIFVPVEETAAEQKAAGGVSVRAVDIEGTPHVLMFTSPARLGAFMGKDAEGSRYASAPGSAIFPSMRGAHAILNPGPKGRAFTPEDIEALLGGAHAHHDHVHGPDCNHDHDDDHGHVHGPDCKH